MAQDCLFCGIAQGAVPSDILYRDEDCFVIRDLNPRAPVHLLIVPLRHVVELTQVAEANEPLVGHLFTVAGAMAKKEGVAQDGYRLAINQGDNAGQTILHLHLHLLGGRPMGPEG